MDVSRFPLQGNIFLSPFIERGKAKSLRTNLKWIEFSIQFLNTYPEANSIRIHKQESFYSQVLKCNLTCQLSSHNIQFSEEL